jgi:deferrochelatase/peroxidase EfeB
MQARVETKSRSVLGATEITLLAPIKRGLIPAQDSRSYESRATLVLATLQALGISRREIDTPPSIPEVADNIRAIRSFRIAIVGREPRQILLSVSFDGGWEPYMRRIWRDLGPLLDLIFCNCEGYLLSSSHPFPAYSAWVRQAQVATGFYYEDSPLTVSDQHLLRGLQGDPCPAPETTGQTPQEQARAALLAFYRLSDMHPPHPPCEDGAVLRRAARLLLGALTDFPAPSLRTPSERAAWEWFKPTEEDEKEKEEAEKAAAAHAAAAKAKPDLANVQAGILERLPGIAHGCMALVELTTADGVSRLIAHLKQALLLSAAASPYQLEGPLFANLAFTHAGLCMAGVDPGTLQQLPQEFREGMAARASILGDWLHNHPSHWTPPRGHGPGAPARIELSRVHALVFYALKGEYLKDWQDFNAPGKTPIKTAVGLLDAALQGVGRVIAVEPMQRYVSEGSQEATGHFQFRDGLSQPGLSAPGRLPRDTVPPGDLLLGYGNSLGDPPLTGRLWTDSTFLVVRKLRQYPERLQALVPSPAAQALLMGRHPDGSNLIDKTTGNDFDYEGEKGKECPLYAHVRRANPRSTRPDLMHLPRILRRGMSYGPPLKGNDANAERGLIFMAYNASIAEQFEVIQGWLGGGNSSGPGSFSGLRDPFLGVARAGDPRCFAWTDPKTGAQHQVELPADQPLVTLQWGLYAFVPSLSALQELAALAAERSQEEAITDIRDPRPEADRDALQRKRDRYDRDEATRVARGAAVIAQLMLAEQTLGFDAAVAQWKIALEDIGARGSGNSQAVWAAIRKLHGGLLRTPYGVLVCSKQLVEEVFANAAQRYTVSGYNGRLARSFGEIYLGLDAGPAYRARADAANKAIMGVTMQQAYASAYKHTAGQLSRLAVPIKVGEHLDVEVKDIVDQALADFCAEWFGLPDGSHVMPGGWHWRSDKFPTCPGHFHSPSRYTFQPQPGDETRRVGEEHGSLLKQQVLQFVRTVRNDAQRQGVLGAQLFTAIGDDAQLATTLIGVMMGFLPTVDGNLRSVLYEWVSEQSLWEHQAELRAQRDASTVMPTLEMARGVLAKPLLRSMQRCPVPELVWRTALSAHVLGTGSHSVEIRPGDLIVVSIVSAMQEDLLAERLDPFPVFGGNRKPPSTTAGLHPTHACPGYDMAMGVMLGFLAALLCSDVTLGTTLSPMSLRLSKP